MKLHLNIGEHCFYSERGQTLEQVVQRGCGVSTSARIRNPTRHSPEQPVLADLYLSRGGWTKRSLEVPFNLKNSMNLRVQSIKANQCLRNFIKTHREDPKIKDKQTLGQQSSFGISGRTCTTSQKLFWFLQNRNHK